MNGVIKFIVVFSAAVMLIILIFFLYNYFWGPKYTTDSHEIDEDFNDVFISTDTADILFLPSEDGRCRVVFHTLESQTRSVKVKDGKLCIDTADSKKWYEHIRIDFDSPTITVYLPRGEYARLTVKRSTGDVEIPKDFSFDSIDISGSTGNTACYASAKNSIRIEESTGDINLSGICAASLDLTASTGKINLSDVVCRGDIKIALSTGKSTLTNVTCESLTSSASTGDLTMTRLVATKKISINRSTGDVKLDGCDAGEIFIKTDTGKVIGTLLSNKFFSVSTDTGKIDVPKSADGGICEIITDTGNIKISIVG